MSNRADVKGEWQSQRETREALVKHLQLNTHLFSQSPWKTGITRRPLETTIQHYSVPVMPLIRVSIIMLVFTTVLTPLYPANLQDVTTCCNLHASYMYFYKYPSILPAHLEVQVLQVYQVFPDHL